MESVDLPPELRVLDESDIGEAVEVSEADEESISAYFHLRIERLVSEIHSINAKINYYRYVLLYRCQNHISETPRLIKRRHWFGV